MRYNKNTCLEKYWIIQNISSILHTSAIVVQHLFILFIKFFNTAKMSFVRWIKELIFNFLTAGLYTDLFNTMLSINWRIINRICKFININVFSIQWSVQLSFMKIKISGVWKVGFIKKLFSFLLILYN